MELSVSIPLYYLHRMFCMWMRYYEFCMDSFICTNCCGFIYLCRSTVSCFIRKEIDIRISFSLSRSLSISLSISLYLSLSVTISLYLFLSVCVSLSLSLFWWVHSVGLFCRSLSFVGLFCGSLLQGCGSFGRRCMSCDTKHTCCLRRQARRSL